MTRRYFRNVFKMPSGKLYMPMNLHESLESAKKSARKQYNGADTYEFTVAVDYDCFDIHNLSERDND